MFLDYKFKQKLIRAAKCIFRNFVIETKDIITGRNYFVIASHKSLASYSELYLGKDKELVTKKRFVFNYSAIVLKKNKFYTCCVKVNKKT